MITGKGLPWRCGLLGIVLFSGCGKPELPAAGFINQTRHSDAHLWALWRTAQQSLSEEIDLNPLQQELKNAPPDLMPGDARVWNVSPRQLLVAPQPDVSAAQFYATTGTLRNDPTGYILCPQPCNLNYTPAYSLYLRPASRYAASWEFAGDNFDLLVQYEFENQILHALGYDTRWR